METDLIANTVNEWILNPAFYLDKSNSTDELLNEEKASLNKCIELIGNSLNITNVAYIPIQTYYKRIMDSIRNNQKTHWNGFGWFIASEHHLTDQLKNKRKIVCLKCLKEITNHTQAKYAVAFKESDIDYRLKYQFPKSVVICDGCENTFNIPAPKNYFEGVVALIVMSVYIRNNDFLSVTKSLDKIQREFETVKDRELELATQLIEQEANLAKTQEKLVNVVEMQKNLDGKFQVEYDRFSAILANQNKKLEAINTDNHIGKLTDQLESLQETIETFVFKNSSGCLDKYQCRICSENGIDVVMSCGHSLCAACDSKIISTHQPCPFCRQIIATRIKLFS